MDANEMYTDGEVSVVPLKMAVASSTEEVRVVFAKVPFGRWFVAVAGQYSSSTVPPRIVHRPQSGDTSHSRYCGHSGMEGSVALDGGMTVVHFVWMLVLLRVV